MLIFLYSRNVTPSQVSIFGTFISCLISVALIPFGFAWQASVLLGIFLFSDAVDGMLARKMGVCTDYGAFLDSVLDRITDGVIFISITLYCVYFFDGFQKHLAVVLSLLALLCAYIISYTRAKGAIYGAEPVVGITERTDRLVIVLVALAFSDFGWGNWILLSALIYLVLAGSFTIYQRMFYVKNKLNSNLLL